MLDTLEKPSINKEQLQNKEHFCRYLGLVALALDRQTSQEHLEQQVITELAESLDTEMGTHALPIELLVSDGELCDADGRSMSTSAANWSALQALRAVQDPNLEWFAQIAALEAKEHRDVVTFAESGAVGDVLVIVSPFPEEAHDSFETREYVSNEGFRPDIQRAFIRAYEKTTEGVKEHIQSVDTSSALAWNETFEQTYGEANAGRAIGSTDILAQRRYFKDTPASEIVERLVMTYDDTMCAKTGNTHRYGRSPGASLEANQFVRSHMPIVKDTILELTEIKERGHVADEKADRILYNSKALINTLFLNRDTQTITDVRAERGGAGANAAANGEVFYGCSGASSSVAEQAQQLSHAETFTMKHGIEEVAIGSCPVCGAGCIKGYRDTKTKRFTSCSNKKCKSYNQSVVDRFNGREGSSINDIFAELLVSLFAPKKEKH